MGFPYHFSLYKRSTKQHKSSNKASQNKKQWSPDPATFMTSWEVGKMLLAAEQRKSHSWTGVKDWIFVVLGLNTGLRISEIASLQCHHVIVSGAIYSHVLVANGKGDKARRVPLNAPSLEAIANYIQLKASFGEKIVGEEPFLRSPIGASHYSRWGLYKAFKRVLALAEGIENPGRFHPHSMRHTFGTHLYRSSNYNLRLVQELLGHSHSRVTEVYASIFDPDRTEALEGLYGE